MSKKFCGGIFYDPKIMIELGIDHPVSLLYYITKKDEYFGIEIVKIQHNEDSKITREVGNIIDISKKEDDVLRIIEKLKKYYVTPVVMGDVIADMKYEITPRR